MRLITHNMLQCHVKGCKSDNYPLEIQEPQVEIVESEFNESFIRKMIPRLDWNALVQSIMSLGVSDFPREISENPTLEQCRLVHHAILEHSVKSGRMVCKGCGHVYLIDEGIPNMLLQNKEV